MGAQPKGAVRALLAKHLSAQPALPEPELEPEVAELEAEDLASVIAGLQTIDATPPPRAPRSAVAVSDDEGRAWRAQTGWAQGRRNDAARYKRARYRLANISSRFATSASTAHTSSM
jgi:hypothetical protein